MLANAYHLMLRPGASVIAGLGGLHRFMAWDKPILTDSGGFQAMSLGGKATDDGVVFKSIYDGSFHELTAEGAVLVQEQLGPDFAVALDLCPALPSSPEIVEDAMRRSIAWSARGRDAHSRPDQALVGVVQGGVDPDLRIESATKMTSIGFDVFAVGGLAVGEPVEEMLSTLDVVVPHLPNDRLRYLMGVGDPYGIVEAVARGIDLFDCVLPTRLARHGTALTSSGKLNLRAASLATSDAPIDLKCDCRTCSQYSRAYLRHLLSVGEELGKRAITIHNLRFLLGLMESIRESLANGTFDAIRREIASSWRPSLEPGSVDHAIARHGGQ